MRIDDLLFSQGFGTRRECAGLVLAGQVRVHGRTVDRPDAELEAQDLDFEVQGQRWRYRAPALLMLNKPAGFECSQQPRHHPSVLSLLPSPLRRRGVQPVGRLDADTTGLLLLTDDGALIHRLTHPKRHVDKVYEVTARHAVHEDQCRRLVDGVVLDDDPRPVRAAACEITTSHTLRLTLTDGRYHQVKRMLAAVGNRCEALHRSAFAGLRLPPDLGSGQWRWLDPEDLAPGGARPPPRAAAASGSRGPP